MIKLSHVFKTFDSGITYVVKDLSLTVAPGETLVLLGSSGCGKTTTLKMLNRLVEPDEGVIEVDGVNVKDVDVIQLRRQMGYAFQGTGLFPHMTVRENISIVLKLMGQSKKQQVARAKELMALINLPYEKFACRFPKELSGGQQQRVGVARALAANPNYLLMDEPFGALDAITRTELQDELIHLKEKLNKTIVFVTHDITEAIKLADRIAVMHQGKLEQVGTVDDILNRPNTEFVANLFQQHAAQVQNYLKQAE